MIRGFITGQSLKLSSSEIVDGTIDYITAQFCFQTADWDAISRKWAHFSCGDTAYDIELVNDRIEKEQHLNLTAGEWEIWLHGVRELNGEVVERITTNQMRVVVSATGTTETGSLFPGTPADAVEKMRAEMGDLSELKTEDKQTLVGAINEAMQSGDVSPEAIAAAVEQYLTENPVEISEDDPTVSEWAKQPEKPVYTAGEVGADPAGTAAGAVSAHNVDTDAHNDIRLLVEELARRFNALADSENIDLDQLSEIIAYIQDNRELIDSVTTSKISYADIVDNLTTNVANKPLSAAQGVALKTLIDAITVPTKLSELTDDSTHRTVTDAEKTAWNNKSDFDGSYNSLDDKPAIPTVPTNVSAFTNDAGYIVVSRNTFADGAAVVIPSGSSKWTATEAISTLTVTYPDEDFETWLRFTTASSGDISISIPMDNYIGSLPEFGNGETWEISVENGVVIAGKVEVNA